MIDSNPANKDIIPTISFSNMIWIFFDALINFLKHFIRFLFKNRFLLLICTLIGLLVGYLTTKVSEPKYLTTMMFKYTELTPQTFGIMLKELDNLAENGASLELGKSLNLPNEITKKVVSIDCKNLNDETLDTDTTQINNRIFKVELTTTESNIADKLKTSLLTYFNTNPFLNKLKTDKLKQYQNKLLFIKSELKKLDSLKVEYNQFLSTSKSNAMFFNNAFNPVDIYKQSSSLYDEQIEIEQWLEQNKLTLISIDPSTSNVLQQSKSLVKQALLFALISFLLGCLIAGVRNIIKYG